jgi:hypothetical protein
MSLKRRLFERLMRLPLTKRGLASIRWRSGLDADLAGIGSRIEAEELRSRTEVEELRSRLEGIEQTVTASSEQLPSRIEWNETVRAASVWAALLFGSNWSALAPLAAEPTISIVLATRNRATRLRRAIESVLAQSYPEWELIVVDDASTDDTPSVVESVEDARVRLVQSSGSGAARARNVGLREASGSIVAFLDDDNLMAPGWLRAIAVALQERPELNAVYGAQLRSGERVVPGGPFLLFEMPFDWPLLLERNFIDLGVVAHRHGLEGLSFDEDLSRLIDWDYVVTLAGRFGIEPLPVVASFYTTDAPSRITDSRSVEREVAQLQRRFQRAFGREAHAAHDSSAE